MHRVLSRPMGVHWAGWRTDTFALQSSGWSIAVDHDAYRNQYRLALRHRSMTLYAITNALTVERMRADVWMEQDLPVFQVQHVAASIEVIRMNAGFDFANFQPIDATPTFV